MRGYDHSRARIYAKGNAYAVDNVPYALSIASNQLAVAMRTNGQYIVLNWDLAAHGVSRGAWHHAAATFDGASHALVLYLDGSPVACSTDPVGIGNNADPVTIGSDGPTSSDTFWHGKIDDVRIWNVARSAAQIQSAYRGSFRAPRPASSATGSSMKAPAPPAPTRRARRRTPRYME